MDTSERYIKMCEGAPRDLWKPRFGDMVFFKGRPMYLINWIEMNVVGETDLLIVEDKRKESSWMPTFHKVKEKDVVPAYRQDQLQEMMGFENSLASWNLHWTFHEWIIKTRFNYEDASMEQLWLAFVMKEKSGKVWDSKKEGWRE